VKNFDPEVIENKVSADKPTKPAVEKEKDVKKSYKSKEEESKPVAGKPQYV